MTFISAIVQRRRSEPTSGDSGFTLLETLVSLTIIGMVMAALSVFFVRGTSTNRRQGELQSAMRIATDGMEEVHQLQGIALIGGRSQAAVTGQWVAPGVSAYLTPTKTMLVWDAPPVSSAPALPVTPRTVTVGGVDTVFSQSWYVGQCWKPVNGPDCSVVAVGLRPSYIPLYRAIVAVTWQSNACAANLCSFVAATLLNVATTDPQFAAS